MTWLKSDDQLPTRREWIAIDEVATKRAGSLAAGRQLAQRAKLLSQCASLWGARANCDGILPIGSLGQICAIASMSIEELEEAAAVLVASRMWRSPRAKERAAFVMLVSWEPGDQPTAEQVAENRRRHTRAKNLSTVDKPNALAARARGAGQCEYCDRQLGDGGELDHVDPAGGNDLDNLALACRKCNRGKRDMTLQEARMAFTKRAEKTRRTFTASTTASRPDA